MGLSVCAKKMGITPYQLCQMEKGETELNTDLYENVFKEHFPEEYNEIVKGVITRENIKQYLKDIQCGKYDEEM